MDYVKALPDSYNKLYGSNNQRLLSLEENLIKAFLVDVDAAVAALNVHATTGKTLDLYGDMVGQYRNGASDEQYRLLILGKMSRCFCKGDYNSTIEQLAVVFGCDKSLISFIETEGDCEVTLETFPMEIALNAGLSPMQLFEIVKNLLPIGVRLKPFELSGTFEFAATADEYDEDAGFADLEQTIGGYLGMIAGDS